MKIGMWKLFKYAMEYNQIKKILQQISLYHLQQDKNTFCPFIYTYDLYFIVIIII